MELGEITMNKIEIEYILISMRTSDKEKKLKEFASKGITFIS